MGALGLLGNGHFREALSPGAGADRLSLQMPPGGAGRGRQQRGGLCAQRPSWHLGWGDSSWALAPLLPYLTASPGTSGRMLLLLGQAGGGGGGGQKEWMFDQLLRHSLPRSP